MNDYIQVTDGAGPIYRILVEGETFEEQLQRGQRIGFSTGKKTIIEMGSTYREWRGQFWAPRAVQFPAVDSVTLAVLLSLFRTRYLYLKDIRENENGIDGGEWLSVYWADGPIVRWEQPLHQTALMNFHLIEKEGL